VLALARPYLPRAAVAAGWLLVPAVLLLVGLGRIDAGEHWPSDVLGGLALGVGWTALALAVRRLSEPLRPPRSGPGEGWGGAGRSRRPGPVVGGRERQEGEIPAARPHSKLPAPYTRFRPQRGGFSRPGAMGHLSRFVESGPPA
jgi:hypothetical protein